jgi:nucleotide-binding universal stress UspA family protein
LPVEADAIIISVADIFMPPQPPLAPGMPDPDFGDPSSSEVKRSREQISYALEEARERASRANEKLRGSFPGWAVCPYASVLTPAWAIIEKADAWRPDLIVLGTHNRSALGRLVLGSVSQTVLTEAVGSVRIARARLTEESSPVQILVGVDGSAGAALAVAEVAKRRWPPGSKVFLVLVRDWSLITAWNWIDGAFKDQQPWMESILGNATEMLRASGLTVFEIVSAGEAQVVLIEQAKRLKVDCVFLGARGLRKLQRLLLGSVSSAVAARAPCSVEIVRPRQIAERSEPAASH